MDQFPPFLLIAAVPLACLVTLALIKHLDWVPVAIVVAATATTVNFAKGVTPALVVTAGGAVLVLLVKALTRGVVPRGRSPVVVPAAVFAGLSVLSAIWGYVGGDPLVFQRNSRADFFLIQGAQLAVIALSPIALILTSAVVSSSNLLERLTNWYLGLTTVGMVLSLVGSPLQMNLGGLVLTWTVCLAYGQLLFNDQMPPRRRYLLWGILALALFIKVGLAITWLSGWVPTLIAMVVITVLRSRKAAMTLLAAAILAAVVSSAYWQSQYDREFEESGATRQEKWSLVLSQPFVQEHILLGTGPANYALYFWVYTPTNLLSTHNNYMDLLLQMGLIGLAAMAWMLWSCGRLAHQLSREPLDPFVRGYVNSAAGGLVAVVISMALGDWFTPFVYNQGLEGYAWTIQSWVFLGGLSAVPAIVYSERADDDDLGDDGEELELEAAHVA